MTDDDLARLVELVVAGAPPLTGEQVSELRRLLKPWEWAPAKAPNTVRGTHPNRAPGRAA